MLEHWAFVKPFFLFFTVKRIRGAYKISGYQEHELAEKVIYSSIFEKQ